MTNAARGTTSAFCKLTVGNVTFQSKVTLKSVYYLNKLLIKLQHLILIKYYDYMGNYLINDFVFTNEINC